jgi:hypothetical protein
VTVCRSPWYSRTSTVPASRRRGRSSPGLSPRARPSRCFAVSGSSPPWARGANHHQPGLIAIPERRDRRHHLRTQRSVAGGAEKNSHTGRSHPACKLATAITPAQNSATFEGSRGVMRGPRLPPALRRQRPAWRGAANRPLVRHARGDRCNKGRMRRSPYRPRYRPARSHRRLSGMASPHPSFAAGRRRPKVDARPRPRSPRKFRSSLPPRFIISHSPDCHFRDAEAPSSLATNFPVRSKFAGARSRLTWQDPLGNR